MRFCKQCNHELKGNEKFCTNCGAPIEDEDNNSVNETTSELKLNVNEEKPLLKKSKTLNKKSKLVLGIVSCLIIILICFTFILGSRSKLNTDILIYIKDGNLNYTTPDGTSMELLVNNYSKHLFDDDYYSDSSVDEWMQATTVFDGKTLYFLRDIREEGDEYFEANLVAVDVSSKKKDAKKIDSISWYGNPVYGDQLIQSTETYYLREPYILIDNSVYYISKGKLNKFSNDKMEQVLDSVTEIDRIDDTNLKVERDNGAIGIYHDENSEYVELIKEDISKAYISYINSNCDIIYYIYDNKMYCYKDGKATEVVLEGSVDECTGITYFNDGSFYYLMEEEKTINLSQFVSDKNYTADSKIKEPLEEDFTSSEVDVSLYEELSEYYKELKEGYQNYIDNMEEYYTYYNSLEEYMVGEEYYSNYYYYVYYYQEDYADFESYLKASCTEEVVDYDALEEARSNYYDVENRNYVRDSLRNYESDFAYYVYDLYYVNNNKSQKVADNISHYTGSYTNINKETQPEKMHTITYYKMPTDLENLYDVEDLVDNYLSDYENSLYEQMYSSGQMFVAIDGVEKNLGLGQGNDYDLNLSKDGSVIYYHVYDESNNAQINRINLKDKDYTVTVVDKEATFANTASDGQIYYFRNVNEGIGEFCVDARVLYRDMEYSNVSSFNINDNQIVVIDNYDNGYVTYDLYFGLSGSELDKIENVKSFYTINEKQLFYVTNNGDLYCWKEDKSIKLDINVGNAAIPQNGNYVTVLYSIYD